MTAIGLKITFHINDKAIGDEYNLTKVFNNRIQGIEVEILTTEYCDI